VFGATDHLLGPRAVDGQRTDSFPEAKAVDAGSDRVDVADDLIALDERKRRPEGVISLSLREVRGAGAGRADPNAKLARAGLGEGEGDFFELVEIALSLELYGAIGRRHDDYLGTRKAACGSGRRKLIYRLRSSCHSIPQ
jgi:hypothetical protein